MARLIKGSTQLLRDTAPILPTDAPNVDRLLANVSPIVWQHGLSWYEDLNSYARELADSGGYTVRQVADVFACYSINNQWVSNVSMARKAVLDGYRLGLINRKHGMDIPYWVSQILDNGVTLDSLVGSNGRKIRTFSRNIQLLYGVTVDRWIYTAYDKPNNDTWYTWISRRITVLAASYGIRDYEMQAIIWLAAAVDAGKNIAGYTAKPVMYKDRIAAQRVIARAVKAESANSIGVVA